MWDRQKKSGQKLLKEVKNNNNNTDDYGIVDQFFDSEPEADAETEHLEEL